MRYGDISDSVFCCGMAMARDLPDINYAKRIFQPGQKPGDIKTEDAIRRPHFDDVDVYSFPQSWGSTALGFGGMGGAAISTAQTTVVVSNPSASVYFGRRLAYTIKKINSSFMADVYRQNMESVHRSSKYVDKT